MKHLALPASLLLLCILGCNTSTPVSSGPNGQPASTAPSGDIRRAQVNQTKGFNGLNLTIGEIALESGKITVGMTLKNPTKETLTFYPDQGQLIIGTTQLSANMFMGEGSLGGEIHDGVEKRGSLVFLDTTNTVRPADVREIDFRLGNVFGKDFMKSVDVQWKLQIP